VKIRPLAIEGAFEVTPVQHGDTRGRFMEWYRFDVLAATVGHPLDLAQANLSTSARDVVRGIHFADVPPGQAKYITCVSGAILDVIVDLRVGSPTFGTWEAVRLDDEERRAVYLAEGLGHGFCSLTAGATVTYLCSSTYSPTREHGIHPLDADLGIAWPTGTPLLSTKDAAAPTLVEAQATGLLPRYSACSTYVESLRRI
jgi:dTDP-4-dehydrorhamnose 3,5-epimerase